MSQNELAAKLDRDAALLRQAREVGKLLDAAYEAMHEAARAGDTLAYAQASINVDVLHSKQDFTFGQLNETQPLYGNLSLSWYDSETGKGIMSDYEAARLAVDDSGIPAWLREIAAV